MRKFYFTPGYYEWHFSDENGNVLFNMVDPLDGLFHEDDTPLNKGELFAFVSEQLDAADYAYSCNLPYNGVLLGRPLTAIEKRWAADIITEKLYNYYIA